MVNKINIVAVIGIGFLGKQIAFQTASFDYIVRLYDVNTEMLEKEAKKLKRKKKRLGVSGDVTFHNTISEAVNDADLIIEAVPEKLELKKKIFAEIDKYAPPHAIIATNSSSIPISRIEDAVKRKDKVMNMHFYSLLFPMVDIMRGTKTSDETFEIGKKYVESIEYTPLIVKKECYGFVFNRIWRACKKEALEIWAGGYADIETVDTAWKIFTGMSVGPFQLMDNVGLDTVYNVEMSYYKESGDPRDKPPQKLKDMIDRGELGARTKKGFYTY
ncbi:MAG: 3-hydroxyacyl-CoA dehydrogenase family protein [Candidatus Hermodarchaeota archaeon]